MDRTLPATMRRIVATAAGGPEVLTLSEGPVPVPGAGEVLIQVTAAGVNRPDILQRQGRYPPPPGASPILGLEVAGTIAASGLQAVPWRIGDRVCALVSGGGYAEYCLAPAPQCLPAPESLPLAEAAALPETFFTVWTNLLVRGRLAQGETVLIHGGSGGIGTTAIQLAREFGARVLATAGSEEKGAACRALGAEPINYRTHDFVAEARRLTEGRGPDIILDMVGGSYLARNVDLLAAEGRLIQIAFLQGSRVEMDFSPVITKRLTLTGSTLRPRSVAEKGAIARDLEKHVWPLIAAGKVRPVMDQAFPLAAAAAAHARMESRAHIGKIVLQVME